MQRLFFSHLASTGTLSLLLLTAFEPAASGAPSQPAGAAAKSTTGQQSLQTAGADKRNQAIALYNAKDYRGAVQLLDQYLATCKNDPYAYYYAAMANQQLGANNQSCQYYRQVFSLAPSSQLGTYAKNILLKLDPAFASQVANMKTTAPQQTNGTGPGASAATPARNAAPAAAGGSGGGDTVAYDPSLPGECRVRYEKAVSHIFLDTSINGRRLKMMFDTGAPNTCVGKNQLEEIGAPLPTGPPEGTTGGSSSSALVPYWIVKADIKVGQIEKKGANLMVLENNSADPLLGQEFFQNFDYTIDQGAGEIVFRQKAMAAKAGPIRNSVSVPFQFKKEGSRIVVQITINGKTGPVMFDSGNTASALSFFNRAEAAKFGVTVPDDAVLARHTGVNGSGTCLNFTVSRIQLGPIDRSNVEVSVNEGTDLSEEGLPLLGQPFWQGYEYTIDMDQKKIFFVRR